MCSDRTAPRSLLECRRRNASSGAERAERRGVIFNGRKVSITLRPSVWTRFTELAKKSGGAPVVIAAWKLNDTAALVPAIERYVAETSLEPVYSYVTRDSWLGALVEAMRPVFAARGYPLPERINATLGFPSKGWRGKARGECWASKASARGWTEIYVHPCETDIVRIANILTHELCHAAIDCRGGHGREFQRVSAALDLEGKPAQRMGGVVWAAWATPLIERVGPMPHAALAEYVARAKKQTTRLIKCECAECGAIWRTSAKVISGIGCGFMRCLDPDCFASINLDAFKQGD